MTKTEANKILDKVKDGQPYNFEQISAALFATGDLYAGMRGEGMAATLQSQDDRAWPGACQELVGVSQNGHRAQAWQGWSRYLDQQHEQAAP